MKNIELLPELNRKETCEKVDKFFKNHVERLVLLAGSRLIDLSSPNLSNAPSGSSFNNNQENQLINGIDAQNIVKSINDALNRGIDPVSRKILIGLYINHDRWIDVQNVIYKEHTSFAKLRNRALLAFASSFEGWQLKNNVDEPIKLNVYYSRTK